MKKTSFFQLILFVLFGFLLISKPSISAGDPARLLVHLTGYLAKDYSQTVSQGKVTNSSEYQEQVEFSNLALKAYQEIEKKPSSNQLETKLKKLTELIQQKANGNEVTKLAREIQKDAIQTFQLKIIPSTWPNLIQGQKLYSQNCVSCHGTQGKGDGPLANQLNPKPTNFTDANRMSHLSPFQVFNTIRLGVPNTAMVGFEKFSDQETWDLAFYILSLRHQKTTSPLSPSTEKEKHLESILQKFSLSEISSSSDEELLAKIEGNEEEKEKILKLIRLHSNQSPPDNPLSIGKTHLQSSLKAYQENQFKLAEQEAVLAYLQGIEPIEPVLRVKNLSLVSELEKKMGSLRSQILSHASSKEVEKTIQEIEKTMGQTELILAEKNASSWFIFLMANSILLREGFEAILVIIAILGVVRTSNNKKGVLWVHAGWGAAILLGIFAWVFSGWLIQMSGATRELMEGVTALIAVSVLIYVGLWLHHKTEISRWTAFIDGQVKTALAAKSLWGLSFIAFMAVFREVFETVLFLRSLALEGGEATKPALLAGTLSAFIFVFLLAFALLKMSAKIPLKKIFNISSFLIMFLAIILIGKGMKSLQETGLVSITSLPIHLRIDLLGIFPTLETLIAQGLTFILIMILWNYGKRTSMKAVDLPT